MRFCTQREVRWGAERGYLQAFEVCAGVKGIISPEKHGAWERHPERLN